jgi:serine O-acetyltransferase
MFNTFKLCKSSAQTINLLAPLKSSSLQARAAIPEIPVSRTSEPIQDRSLHTLGKVRKDRPAPFWSTVVADVHRFRQEDDSFRALVRGLLSQGFQALIVYRIFRWFYERRVPTQPVRFFVERFIEVTTGISIPAQAAIGKGLRIHHFGGIIIHSAAVIGESCTIYHGVTLGDRGGWGGAPRVGNRVLIGAGAKLIGEIVIGDDCVIGANAVVHTSVPAGHTAVGVPAEHKRREPAKNTDPSL